MTKELENFELELKEYLTEGISKFYKLSEPTSKLRFYYFIENIEISPCIIAEFCGGLNGSGNWFEYMKDISTLFAILQSKYDCWLVSLVNDCPDDVFTLKIAFSIKNGKV